MENDNKYSTAMQNAAALFKKAVKSGDYELMSNIMYIFDDASFVEDEYSKKMLDDINKLIDDAEKAGISGCQYSSKARMLREFVNMLSGKMKRKVDMKDNAASLTTDLSFNAYDSELQEATYYVPKGYHVAMYGNRVVVKKGDAKDVILTQDYDTQQEYSENDNAVFLNVCKNALSKYQASGSGWDANIISKWLDDKVNNKHFSDEDERILTFIINDIECLKDNELTDNIKDMYKREIEWLHQLRQRM